MDLLRLTDRTVDLRTRTVNHDGDVVRLTTREADLLEYLVARPGEAVARDELLVEVWGYGEGVVSRTADTTLQRLRAKIEADPKRPVHLFTDVGRGYRFEPLRTRPEVIGPARSVADEAGPTPTITGVFVRVSEPPSSFVGREDALRFLRAAFADGARLVTIVGPGGAGKTRLARRYASQEWPGEAAFCDLSDAKTAAGVVGETARAMNVPLKPEGASTQAALQLAHALAGRTDTLMVLDNLEQVVGPAAEVVRSWRAEAPEVRFLATSREALGVPGERVLRLDALSLDDAVELFAIRARAVGRDVQPLDPAIRDLLEEIVGLLDHLALAIELAAARTSLLSLEEVRDRLAQRFRLLSERSRTRPERHRTLHDAIDWSWQLLSPREREVLADVSILRGPFDVTTAEEIVGPSDDPDDDSWTLDVLEALVDKSLLKRETTPPGEPPGPPRLGMLLAIREFARAKLARSGREEACRRRHLAYFCRAGLAAAEALADRMDVPSLMALERLRADLLGAHRDAVGRSPLGVARTALALDGLLAARGPHAVHLGVLDSAVDALPGLDAGLQARILSCRSDARRRRGMPREALADADAAWAVLEEDAGGDVVEPLLAGRARWRQGQCAAMLGRLDDAEELYALASDATRAAGASGQAVEIEYHRAILLRHAGRASEAEESYRAVLRDARAAGRPREEGGALGALGLLLAAAGKTDEAERMLLRALALQEEIGDRRALAVAHGNLGMFFGNQGRARKAVAAYEAAVERVAELGDPWLEALLLRNLAIVGLGAGRGDRAEAALAQALALHRRMGDTRNEGRCLAELGDVLIDGGRLGEARRNYREARALARVAADLNGEGTAAGNLALIDLLEGDAVAAGAGFSEALARLDEVGEVYARAFFGLYAAAAAARRGDLEAADRLLEDARSRLHRLADARAPVMLQGITAIIEHARGGTPDDLAAAADEVRAHAETSGDVRVLARLLAGASAP